MATIANQYLFRQGLSNELGPFPHIVELGAKKNQTIHLNSFPVENARHCKIYYVSEGRFDWTIDGACHILYPGDLAIILPGQQFGGARSLLDIGTVWWIDLNIDLADNNPITHNPRNPLKPHHPPNPPINSLTPHSGLNPLESRSIKKILLLNDAPVVTGTRECGSILQAIARELQTQEIGFQTRINQYVDSLFIVIARSLTRQNNAQRDFPRTFMRLEQELRGNLSHQWTVEEMAALVGLGTTAFTEKVKSYTGFSPMSYLINIRISEAIRMLKQKDIQLTDIALDTGFYSSQHFSTTFKRLTGYTPSQFRKNNTDQA